MQRKNLSLRFAMKSIFISIFSLSLIVCCLSISVGCANIIPPEGGARDSLPPVLLDVTPDDSTRNFDAKRIVLEFDEYIDLQDVQNNLLFTPTFETNPIIEAKLRTITIRLKDSLERNTTYTFDFGNAIRDIKAVGDKSTAGKDLPEVISMIDRLAKRGVIHKNKASNLKSKLTKRVNTLA